MNFQQFKEKIFSYQDYSQDLELIKKAYDFGEIIYEGIKRKSGEPYFNHCLRTAINLAELELDIKTIIAGILHDALEDTKTDEKIIKEEFDDEVLFLIKGVTKIGHFKYREKNLIQAENLRKLILYIVKDPRVALIKLADRLDNMRTLNYLPEEKRKRIALETQDIYVPLARRLGVEKFAGELEELAFKYLEPEKYKEIEKEVNKIIKNGREYLENLIPVIEKEIRKGGINSFKIDYRVKRIPSIYKKLERKNFDLNQIYDILAFRIIVSTVEECYSVLGIIHSLFKPLIHEFDDYIAVPKPNGYRSLHTTVIGPENKFIEFQIRTKEMHLYNEMGIAANFSYAESKESKNYKKNLAIFAEEEDLKIVQALRQNNQSSDFIDILKEKIYVFTPKGEIIKLPAESTPLDFAYKIHTEIGNHFAGARVNEKIVPIDYKLNNGDVVEIIINKNRKPSIDWLYIVKSEKAKKKIKNALKKETLASKTTCEINISANDRVGLLKDIAQIISSKNINIVESKSKVKRGIAHISFLIKANSKNEVKNIKNLIKNKIKEIIEVR